MSILPYHECPSFEGCSCNVCPLDPDAGKRFAVKGEEACHAWRKTREAIAAKYPELLPDGGRTIKEIRHDKKSIKWHERFNTMSDAEKEATMLRLRGLHRKRARFAMSDTMGTTPGELNGSGGSR